MLQIAAKRQDNLVEECRRSMVALPPAIFTHFVCNTFYDEKVRLLRIFLGGIFITYRLPYTVRATYRIIDRPPFPATQTFPHPDWCKG